MPKIINHDQYREDMIIKCFELFGKKGFINVTMREIAADLNVSTGALYHYFPTKQAIFEQMMSYIIKKDLERLREATNLDELPEDRMIKAGEVIDKNKEYYQKILLLTLDYFRNQPEGDTEEMFKRFARNYIDTISSQIDLPEQMSDSIFYWLIGLIYAGLLCPSLVSIEEQFKMITEMMRVVREKML
jgi:AcrR family transcriptional regulator